MRIEFHKEKDLSTKMVSLKRNWISKVRSCARGARDTLCYYTFIRCHSHQHTLTRSQHIFSHFTPFQIVSIPSPEAHNEKKNVFQTRRSCCCSQSVVFKMEFHVSDCGIPFHHRVTPNKAVWTRRERRKSPVEVVASKLWSIFLFFFKEILFWTCRDSASFFSFFNCPQQESVMTLIKINNLWIFPFVAHCVA